MSKTIKLEDEVYERLDLLHLNHRETFSQIVARLLLLQEKFKEIRQTLDGESREKESKP